MSKREQKLRVTTGQAQGATSLKDILVATRIDVLQEARAQGALYANRESLLPGVCSRLRRRALR